MGSEQILKGGFFGGRGEVKSFLKVIETGFSDEA